MRKSASRFFIDAEPLWALFRDPFLRQAFRRASGGPGTAPIAGAPIPRPKAPTPAAEARTLEAAHG